MKSAIQIAKTTLHLKSPRARAFASQMGRAHRGPYDYWTCRKVSDACRFIKSLAPEARRYFIAERKARWLTNCIVAHPDRKTFDLAGIAPDGIPYDIHIEMPLDATLLDFLLLVMRCEDAHWIMRTDAAKIAAPLMHERPKPVIMVERACTARPTPAPRPSPEERMKIRRQQQAAWARRKRRLSHVATDAADPAVAEG
jgi:hypothetical protein